MASTILVESRHWSPGVVFMCLRFKISQAHGAALYPTALHPIVLCLLPSAQRAARCVISEWPGGGTSNFPQFSFVSAARLMAGP